MLPRDTIRNCHLSDLIDHSFKNTQIKDYDCDVCEYPDVEQSFKFDSYPEILVINLLRGKTSTKNYNTD